MKTSNSMTDMQRWGPKVWGSYRVLNCIHGRMNDLVTAQQYLDMGWHVIRALISMAIMGAFRGNTIKGVLQSHSRDVTVWNKWEYSQCSTKAMSCQMAAYL